jgi:PAS domain S-box-containing protein
MVHGDPAMDDDDRNTGRPMDASGELPDRISALEEEIARLRGLAPLQSELAAIIEYSEDAIIGKNLDGVITSWNRAAEKIFGYTAREAIGHSMKILLPADRQEEEIMIIEKIGRGEIVDHFETVRVRKDGALINVSVSISPIKDDSGRIVGASKIARDITAQKRAGDELRKNEEKYRGLIEGMNEALFRISLPDGAYEYVSPSAKDVFGYDEDELFSQPMLIKQAIHPDFRGYLEENLGAMLGGKVPPNLEYKIIDRDGKERWILQSNKGIFDDRGRIIALEGLCRDITERKRLEESLEEERLQLQKALDEVKTLRGVIPICSYCKEIRDDKGAWNQLEKYISEHSEAKFSHGICEKCMARLFPQYIKKK